MALGTCLDIILLTMSANTFGSRAALRVGDRTFEIHRLDSLENIVACDAVGLLFMVPGVDETPPVPLLRPLAQTPFVPADPAQRARHCGEIFAIQSTGLAKRIQHTGGTRVVVGVSGGLDSTLALLVAVRAFDHLGLDHGGIVAVTMPGFGTTQRTRSNAERLAELLGVTLRVIPIAESVRRHFADIGHDEAVHDVTYENAQARERTQILMDVANQIGGFVVGTGDRTEDGVSRDAARVIGQMTHHEPAPKPSGG